MADEAPKPKLTRQLSARRRSLTKPEDKIFAQADSGGDGFLDVAEFQRALQILKESSVKPQEADDAEELEQFHEFLGACVDDQSLLQEVYDELRVSKGVQNDAGVSLAQWRAAEFFEDDSSWLTNGPRPWLKRNDRAVSYAGEQDKMLNSIGHLCHVCAMSVPCLCHVCAMSAPICGPSRMLESGKVGLIVPTAGIVATALISHADACLW
eukprot:CAMPEP_0174721664 /NCGR_PEP_ID=MMETSP1094-20130205/36836_1 /TAXON_ID=156173 /ORGANISM="Chrysochromulina brevifilum, Strain UTEX LB 985" /LENGTH=209 /DNA_ID=CAMNT_0015922401 /DNA_START=12 /DNA_END=639 /DNA_ORIENTATION=-